VAEADSLVTAAYSEQYVEPELSVIVTESMGRRVYVLGEVENPEMVKVPREGLGIIGAITLAGGFTDDAARGGTVLIRVTPTGYMVQEIDLGNLQDPRNAAMAMAPLEAFDVVYVPRSRMGDFGYFSRTVLSGLVNITRMAADIKYLSTGSWGRY
jgi:polysaccharide export outer membrane protein